MTGARVVVGKLEVERTKEFKPKGKEHPIDQTIDDGETFTFGGMFAHIITQNTQRRLHALDAFHRLGVPMSGMGDPMEWEAEQRKAP